MNSIEYIEAKKCDCLEIAELKGEVWNTTYRGIYTDADIDNYDIHENEKKFTDIVSDPHVALFIARDNRKIIGYMSCGKPYRPFLGYEQEIGLLYILKQYQGRGVGRKLFEIGKDIIKNNGYNEFFISCNKYNDNALNFYEKMGGAIKHIDEDIEDRRNSQVKFHYQI